jgi:hypothetical protein
MKVTYTKQKPQNFRCHKNSLAHLATENNDMRLQIKDKKKKMLPQNFINNMPIFLLK